MGGVFFAQGSIGYVTNILVGVAMIFMAVMLTILDRMETGLPQPEEQAKK